MTLTFRSVLLAALFALVVPAIALAQATSGNINGIATVGDTIIIDGIDNGLHREVVIEKDGKFSLRRIPVGTYQVVVKHADGSFEAPQTAELHSGTTARLK